MGKYKNVSSWGNTSRYQFRLTVLGQVFYGFDFATPEDAAFVCDACKVILWAFGRKLDKRTKLALDDQRFADLCRAKGLDPMCPMSFSQHSSLPESFREFVKEHRPQWEEELLQGPPNPHREIRYARSSDNETIRLWAWAYEFALAKQRRFDAAPKSWWANLIGSLKKSHDTVYCNLAPSLRKSLNPEHYPKLFVALEKAKEATFVATIAAVNLESEIRLVGESIQQEFKELESTRPNVLRR